MEINNFSEDKKIFSVSDYIKIVNQGLKGFRAKIIGEASEVGFGPTGHVYFSLKDEKDESLINCVIWRGNYNLYGIKLEPGMKIIASGAPSLHQKYGFKFIAETIELFGEGRLRKEYERLKKELMSEGLFSVERKKPIPEFPKRIGLITSEGGAVIHDFLNNLGKYGYKIKFFDSRVEGQDAVKDLISAVDYFRKNKGIDVLVIIRGGGSLESLQAFNNEVLVRKIADCSFPVICGIGHDKDVPLASLVADKAVSTPTAAAAALDDGWEAGLNKIEFLGKEILYKYQEELRKVNYFLKESTVKLRRWSLFVVQEFEKLVRRLKLIVVKVSYSIKEKKSLLKLFRDRLTNCFLENIRQVMDFLKNSEKQLEILNPTRRLKFGYSIVYLNGKIISSVSQVKKGDDIDVRVADGEILSIVKKTKNKK
ncbi:MAG TPA: exodeoxyribonuclease VII large subunit [Candidatus Parcubacteria bacterium]|nr:exodeoxyribonuclease VII large subunit [Candidatus Parcubacteria bacterium]